jgi:hypothetical protein
MLETGKQGRQSSVDSAYRRLIVAITFHGFTAVGSSLNESIMMHYFG